jgi:hypothetical protein
VADHDRLDAGTDAPLPDLPIAGVPFLDRTVVVGSDDVLVAFVAMRTWAISPLLMSCHIVPG